MSVATAPATLSFLTASARAVVGVGPTNSPPPPPLPRLSVSVCQQHKWREAGWRQFGLFQFTALSSPAKIYPHRGDSCHLHTHTPAMVLVLVARGGFLVLCGAGGCKGSPYLSPKLTELPVLELRVVDFTKLISGFRNLHDAV